MALDKIFAQLSCTDLSRSIGWFSTVFGREPDDLPMQGLAEWHHGDAGFQLFQGENAGRGTLTLIVIGLQQEHHRLSDAGLQPGAIESADYVELIRLRDPDNNLVVMAQSK
jgi:hypothetical protein